LEFQLEDKTSIELALEDYKKIKADFSDCLIGRRNRASGWGDAHVWSPPQERGYVRGPL